MAGLEFIYKMVPIYPDCLNVGLGAARCYIPVILAVTGFKNVNCNDIQDLALKVLRALKNALRGPKGVAPDVIGIRDEYLQRWRIVKKGHFLGKNPPVELRHRVSQCSVG